MLPGTLCYGKLLSARTVITRSFPARPTRYIATCYRLCFNLVQHKRNALKVLLGMYMFFFSKQFECFA